MAQDHILSFGPFRLDAANARLWCDAHPVRLTAKALQVLQYLTERPGQLVTKDELFRAVWPDTVVSDATLTSNIQAVRQALDDDPRKPQYIETVHRQGFRFIAEVVSGQEEEANQKSKGKSQKSKVKTTETDTMETEDVSAGTRTPEAGLLSQPLAPGLPLPDKPSIVVLPFVNLSGDPTQEYFSDGMTEELTATLSRVSSLFVIARTSAFAYKGKGIKVQEISRELGVRYVLEGSVRRADGQLRIIAQLIDATTGGHVWAEHYDHPLTDIFVVQDAIVQKIVTTLKLQLTLTEQGYLVRRHTDSLEAYDAYLNGLEYFRGFSKEADAQARQMFEKAVALDPQYAEAYVGLGNTYYQDWVLFRGTEPQMLERALMMAHKALALHDSLPKAYSLLSFIYAQKRQYALAIAEGERAIALDPNNTDSYAGLGHVMIWAGRAEEAIGLVEQAMRRNPHYPPWYLFQLGWAYRSTGRYAEAVTPLQEFIRQGPNLPPGHFNLAFSYVCLWAYQHNTDTQALEQALAEAQQVLVLDSSDPFGYVLVGYVYLWQKQYGQAITESEKAIALNPNLANSYAFLAEVLSRVGKVEEALRMVEQALLRKPWVTDEHFGNIGAAYDLAGRPEKAITPLKQFLARYPNVLGAHLTLAVVYSELGQDAEARAEVGEVLRINPNFSLEVHKERVPIKDPATLERHITALHKAGLK